MADPVQWLKAQLNEDEAAAEDTLSLHVRVGRFRGVDVQRWRITKSGTGIIDEDGGTLRAQQIFPAEAAHVIRHDPARVLREINAKRRIVECHEPWTASNGDTICGRCGREHIDGRPGGHFPCQTLRLLASMYADRDGYQEGWAP